MYMVMFVLDDPQRLDDVLNAWDAVGVSGVTIIESTGINRRRRIQQVGTAFMAGINRLTNSEQDGHYTLFVIVQNEKMVTACQHAAQKIVGNLNDPHTGVLAAWKLDAVIGVPAQEN